MMDIQDFVLQEEDGMCIGALAASQGADDTFQEPVWILGALWMKNVVSVFDLGRPAVGFASLRKIDSTYGTQTLIPDSERTALGTGPSASALATFVPNVPGDYSLH
jgi:Eukaryotic aspartyl protease